MILYVSYRNGINDRNVAYFTLIKLMEILFHWNIYSTFSKISKHRDPFYNTAVVLKPQKSVGWKSIA